MFSQVLFALIQLLPSYRSHVLVLNVGCNYFFATIAHSLFLLSVVYEYMDTAFLCICASWLALSPIIDNQKNITPANYSDEAVKRYEFYVLKLPFRLFFAWTTCLVILSLNMAGVDNDWKEDDMLMLTVLSLCVFCVLVSPSNSGYICFVFKP